MWCACERGGGGGVGNSLMCVCVEGGQEISTCVWWREGQR